MCIRGKQYLIIAMNNGIGGIKHSNRNVKMKLLYYLAAIGPHHYDEKRLFFHNIDCN